MVDVSALNRIIEINVEERYVLVEPNVSMGALVKATMPFSLIPPVVMEFPSITVGGGIQGGAGESSSFKWGLFHECALEYEMVLGNGEVITASTTANADLFYDTACSYGSLGIITLVKLKLIEAKPFVRLTYTKTADHTKTIETLLRETKSDVDFVDGTQFNENMGVVMTGMFSDFTEDFSRITFSRATDQWFYLHAESVIEKNNTHSELVPLCDYLFRYNRGGFWMGSHALRRWHIPNTRIIRTLFNPFLLTEQIYEILHATGVSQQYIVQDMSLPSKNAPAFIDFVKNELGIYPQWLCPLKPSKFTNFSPNRIATDMVVNVGMYGKPIYDYDIFMSLNRKLEHEGQVLGGKKVLYAHVYSPEEEFWASYDKSLYESLREKYHASRVFPDIYQKVHTKGKYVPTIFKGFATLTKKKLFSLYKS